MNLVCRYLDALVGLKDSPFLPRCKRITRLRLQAELYSLTQASLSQASTANLTKPDALFLPIEVQGCESSAKNVSHVAGGRPAICAALGE